MKLPTLTLFTLLSVPALAASPVADQLRRDYSDVGAKQFTSADYKPGTIKHIVLFRYANSVTPEQKNDIKQRFLALKTQAQRNGKPYILSIEAGPQSSGEGADQNLEQGFIVTFRSEGDRNYYVGQPLVTDAQYFDAAHQRFKEYVGPMLDENGVVVFDFKVER